MKKNREIQIIGSISGEYSLSRVNRFFASALEKDAQNYDVSLWTNLSQVSKLPDDADFNKYPVLKKLYKNEETSDIAIYNNFPKSATLPYGFKDLKAKVRIGYFAWEESIFPKRYVDECNRYLHGVLVTSEHVKEVFKKSGIRIPMMNIAEGVELEADSSKVFNLNTNKKFKFLHVSSCHFRKGIDVLVKAFCAEFKKDEDVVLVVKHFPNPESELKQALLEYQTENSPEILVIEEGTLSDPELASIYDQSDAVVLPSRAEGFGLPMGEAMLFKKPLITTNYSSQTDFCNDENCFLLDYKLIHSRSNLQTPGALVAEPSFDDLKKKMRFLFENSKSNEVASKVEKAYELITSFNWQNTARKALEFIENVEKIAPLKFKNIGVLTPINSSGGISEYSRDLFSQMESSFQNFRYFAEKDISNRTAKDTDNVVRCWQTGEQNWNELVGELEKVKYDFLHIQYNPSFFSIKSLGLLIDLVTKKNIKIFLSLHSVQITNINFGEIFAELQKVNTIYLHSQADLEYLRNFGLKNVHFFIHGVRKERLASVPFLRKSLRLDEYSPILATHGLIHEKKGLLEMLDAVKILKEKYPNLLYLAVNAVNADNISSYATYTKMQEKIKDLDLKENVLFISEYLSSLEVLRFIQIADVVLFPYSELKESASGAITQAITAQVPIILTNAHIFSDIPFGCRIESNKPELIVEAVEKMLSDKERLNKEKELMKTYIEKNSWEAVVVESMIRYLTS